MPKASLAAKDPNPDRRDAHPTQQDLVRFLRGELTDEDDLKAPAIVRHLLAGCPQCLAITGGSYGPRKRRRRNEIAIAQLESDAQEMLLKLVKDLEEIRKGLQGILGALPPPVPDLDEDDDPSVAAELRAVIGCVLNDSIHPAIADLRAAGFYPEEPPEEDDSGEPA
jgi:hypothetical protein